MDKSAATSFTSSSSLDKIRQHSLHFFSGTVVSRIFGYLRDVAMAYSFGADPLISIFLVGFRTSNLPRRLFGEGALQSILITTYQKEELSCEQTGKDRMFQMQADCNKTWSFCLLGFIALVLLFLTGVEYFSEGASWLVDRYRLILIYTCLMLPGLWFICMSALNDAFLKVHRRFLIGSSAPVAFNIVWILLSLSMKDLQTWESAAWLSQGICIAYLMQWFVTYIGVRQETINTHTQGVFLSHNVRKLIKPMMQGIIGVGATQINGLLDALFAIEAEPAGPTYLWFAIRIEQAPLALIGLAIASVGLPALSAAVEKKEYDHAKTIFDFSQKRMLSYMLAACSAMMCLSFIGVRLALERGDFTPYDTLRTSQCLWGYSLGLMGQGIIFLYQNLGFSLRQYALITRSSIYAVIFNAFSNWLCVNVFGFGAPTIAFTTTIATFFQLFLIKRGLERRYVLFKSPVEWRKILQISVAYTVVFALTQGLLCQFYGVNPVTFLQGIQIPPPDVRTLDSLIVFAEIGALWGLSYLVFAYLLKLPLPEEFAQIWKKIRAIGTKI